MINPLRSEQDAFRFTLIVAALLAPVIVAAVLFGSGVAVAVGAGLALGVAAGLFLLKREQPQEKMRLTGQALRREITHRIGREPAEVRVVCPALNTKLKHWVSDEDQARRHAQERLNAVVAQLQSEGAQVNGDIGDSDPVQAMEDALRLFRADEVIISTHPPGRSNWLERDVVQRARDRFPLPVTHVVVDLEHEREFVAKRE
jgi:nucleotide-binding universal stress UspA family protein